MAKETIKVVQIDTKPAETSVKDLRKQLKDFKDEMANLEEGSDAFLKVANKAGEVKHQLDEINESIKGASSDFGDVVGNVTNVAAGITGAFQAVAGGLQAMGIESEALDETIARMQGLMAVTQGLASIDTAIKSLDKLQESITSTTKAGKLLKAALQPKVFLAIGAAIGVITFAWNKWGDSIKEVFPWLGKTTKQLEEEKKATEKLEKAKEKEETFRKKIGTAIQDTLTSYKLLQGQYKRLQTDYQKTQWIKKNKDEFEKLGISVKNLKDAEDKFVNNTDNVVQALIKRATATAKQEQLAELAAQYIEKKVQAEQEYESRKVQAGSMNIYKSSHTIQGGLEELDRNGRWIFTQKGADKFNQELNDKLIAEANALKTQMETLANDIANEMSIDTIITDTGTTKETKTTKTKTREERLKELGLVEFTDEDLEKGRKRIKDYWDEVFDIQLEQLKRSDKTDKQKLEEELAIEKKRLENIKTYAGEGTLEYEKQQTKIYELQKELNEKIKEENLKHLNEMKKAGDAFFDGLKQTVNAFSDSSLGLSSQWIASLDQFQLAFKQTMDIVSKEGKAGWKSYGNVAATALGGIGTMLNALSNEQDASTEEGFEQQKKLQIAATTMNMLSGIMAAWTSSMALPAPTSFIVGGIQTAATAALGAAQIAKIQSQTMNSAMASGAINPTAVNSMIVPPVQYSNAVQGASTEGAIKNTKVWVAESDIVDTINKVNVCESENTY